MQWKGEWGPASVISGIALLIMIGGGIFALGKFSSIAEDSSRTTAEFHAYKENAIVQMTRMETTLNMLMTASVGKRLEPPTMDTGSIPTPTVRPHGRQ